MGVRSDQLVGYYDSNGVDGNSECHGTHCSDVHLETMVNLDLGFQIDMEAARSLNIDIFVDVAYCYKEEQCYKDADSYAGWLKYYNLAEIGQLNAAMITINLRGKSFLEVIDQYQRLAIAVGDKAERGLGEPLPRDARGDGVDDPRGAEDGDRWNPSDHGVRQRGSRHTLPGAANR